MNLFKRAWWRLWCHPGKTVMLVGLFSVICTLVLSGFLIRSAAARASTDAKSSVGAVATMQLDLNAYLEAGKGGEGGGPGEAAGRLGADADMRRVLVDKLCGSPVVAGCNYTKDGVAGPTDQVKVHQPVPPPPGQSDELDFFKADGVRDLRAAKDFRNGDSKMVSGSGITPDSRSDMVVIEERVAKANRLKVGDRVELNANIQKPDGGLTTRKTGFVVVGVYRNSTADPRTYVSPMQAPSNQIYVSADGATRLDGRKVGADGGYVRSATFTLRDPGDLDRLREDAEAAGLDPGIYPLSVNDKQYKTLVGPIGRTADFASLTVWLVAVAGTVILALIIASNLRERRKEMGILLSLGEKKPKLLGQHLAEVGACAVLAIGFAAAGSQFIAQGVGDRLLSGEVSSARNSAADEAPGQLLTDTTGGGLKEDTGKVEPIDAIEIELGAGDIGAVGATGLGIAALATIVPGIRVLRLHPRDILTKGD
ncbi:FtsX-like permease family protein [Streptomyces sp. SID4919]|uniref:ABC transporter permease n=1 Tax=unclassified Streptomyces TaxID=2593676 RepID=UPI000823D52D|nr:MULTISPECIES: ABC transporter permease [unclassified Streptomyces]MYY13705.1 FtsX-like permease family protein [Streptomyces sp. SID4919]SCK34364.1 putative ABC transport system permease protein [Streptomyces sp. AmelKG-E11A]